MTLVSCNFSPKTNTVFMKITINSRAQADWLERGVHQIKVSFVKKGCKGTKVEVLENFLKD